MKKFVAILIALTLFTPIQILNNGGKVTIGNKEIDKEQIVDYYENKKEENNTIKFSGYGRYVISESSPNIKLKNPEGNSVDFIFTVKDKSSNEIIGVSEKVISGSYAEIDLKHYYNKIGTYKIKIEISTVDSLGNKCSGLGQELDLIVK